MSISSRTVRASRVQLGASILSLVAALTLSSANVVLAQGMKNGDDMKGMGMDKPMKGMDGMEKSAKASEAKASGTVIAINSSDRKITLDHGPIPEIKWPAMKMEFAVAPNVDLSTVKQGEKVDFALSGSGSNYTVQSIVPAK